MCVCVDVEDFVVCFGWSFGGFGSLWAFFERLVGPPKMTLRHSRSLDPPSELVPPCPVQVFTLLRKRPVCTSPPSKVHLLKRGVSVYNICQPHGSWLGG